MTNEYWSAAEELAAYRRALEDLAIVAETDRAGRIIAVNDKFVEISGYSRDELIGQRHSLINSGHHPRQFFVQMWGTIGRGEVWRGEICNRTKHGSLYWVDTTIVPLRKSKERPAGYLSIRYDITAKKGSEAELSSEVARRRAAETLLSEVVEAVPDGIAAFDAKDRLVVHNAAYRQFYDRVSCIRPGATFEEILREAVAAGQFVLGRYADQTETWVMRRLREHIEPGKVSVQHLSGDRWLQVQERRSPNGITVGVRTDITGLKAAERAIRHQAERDSLTGLHNRRVLMWRLETLVRRFSERGGSGSLVLIDIDRFKEVNDTLGHAAGDELLRLTASRIRNTVRSRDTVARLGGDEFAVILRGTDAASRRTVERLDSMLQQPFSFGTATIESGASIGVAHFPGDASDANEVLRHADLALYRAKELGRGRHCHFDTSLRNNVERRDRIASRMRGALANHEFQIALQPQFCIQTLAHKGFEVLARWRTEDPSITPAEFISIAERSGMIVSLGEQIMDLAFETASRLQRSGAMVGRIAINLAAAQLRLPRFAQRIEEKLLHWGLSPAQIELEVTETVLLDRAGEVIEHAIEQLNEMGLSIALDDFGTGHASLTHLRRIPVQTLKIDRSFVAGLGHDHGDEAIVRAIVTLAKSLGKWVVAEGIETEHQLALLRSFGCDIGQGFLVSRPLAAADAEAYLRRSSNATLPLSA